MELTSFTTRCTQVLRAELQQELRLLGLRSPVGIVVSHIFVILIEAIGNKIYNFLIVFPYSNTHCNYSSTTLQYTSTMEYFTLNNGNKIPALSVIGTGTQWGNRTGAGAPVNEKLVDQLLFALNLPGVVHIDIAENYGNYRELGVALKKTSKPRSEIWITDKYSKIAQDPKVALSKSLEACGIDYVDLYLLHDPFNFQEKKGYSLVEAWRMMEELFEAGKAKNIGVSNFGIEPLETLLKEAKVKPVANQIEFNAFLQNQTPGIYDFCQKNDILLEAYSPLSPLSVRDDSEFFKFVDELSAKYGKSAGLVLLRWVYQRGVLPVTTSSKTERIAESNTLFSFELTQQEVDKITELGAQHKTVRKYWNPFYDKYN